MSAILQVFYSAFSGLLLSAAIPNEFFLFGFPFAALLALAPFYHAIKNCKSPKEAFLCGFTQTCVTHLLSSFWLANFMDFAAFTLGASAFGTGIIGGIFGLFLFLPYNSSKKQNPLLDFSIEKSTFRTKDFKVLYFASLYTLYEWVKSTGFLGYPWGTVPSALYRWSLLTQIASITGTYGITFLTALFNALLEERIFSSPVTQKGFQGQTRPSAPGQAPFRMVLQSEKVLAALTLLSLLYGTYQLLKVRVPQKYLTAVMIQQNSDPWKEKSDHDSILRSQRLTKEKLDQLKAENISADFVVWSEGCLRRPFPNSESHYSIFPGEKPLTDFIKETKLPFLLGGRYIKNAEKAQVNNAALVFDKDSNLRGHYGKNHLVPFAEALPGRESEAVRKFLKQYLKISAGWTPGDQIVLFDIPAKWNPDRHLPPYKYLDLSKSWSQESLEEDKAPTVRISTPICFDDAFPEVMGKMSRYGAELFVNITDDSWSLKKSSEIQHFVISSFSSIEYRTPMIRSSNAGYSCVISPTGKVLADSPLFEEYALAYQVPVYAHERTVYARLGNWLPLIILFLFTIYCLIEYFSFEATDYIPSSRKFKKKKKSHKKK
ncbi:apolipoprotein N-acyltransferase [Treponema sp. C6A8]|uniref:apolipoprotein N-acyltransferase n=1 Tax=Treponema sp. C6A8 TaxID=1410609 RepID=UPI00048488C9|nr:apolipoprotein N-acyltransferase [Treponema sp. C6A8]